MSGNGHAGDGIWQPLIHELDAFAAAGQKATFWWRDDDAIEPTAALDRMLALVDRYRAPLGLAVIPSRAKPTLADRLSSAHLVEVVQHGFSHKNHAEPGQRSTEFGANRPLDARRHEIEEGRRLLHGYNLAPIFVPPWNRYDKSMVRDLEQTGLKAISAFGPPDHRSRRIVECNCHVDIISWRTTRGFAGTEKCVRLLADHLHARRRGTAATAGAPNLATGLLTHHLDHDLGCWAFLDELFARLAQHAAAEWITPMQAVTRIELP
jgi:peptidoglycan/xylan/chitin deacetylase (PgdA/CDA1 family)